MQRRLLRLVDEKKCGNNLRTGKWTPTSSILLHWTDVQVEMNAEKKVPVSHERNQVPLGLMYKFGVTGPSSSPVWLHTHTQSPQSRVN